MWPWPILQIIHLEFQISQFEYVFIGSLSLNRLPTYFYLAWLRNFNFIARMLTLLAVSLLAAVSGLDNGLARTPPMGW